MFVIDHNPGYGIYIFLIFSKICKSSQYVTHLHPVIIYYDPYFLGYPGIPCAGSDVSSLNPSSSGSASHNLLSLPKVTSGPTITCEYT